MMEQMLKLCLFLRREKLTLVGAIGTEIRIMYEPRVDFFGLFTYALNARSWMKRCSNKLSVHSESVLKPQTEHINCLHPGALKTSCVEPRWRCTTVGLCLHVTFQVKI